MAEYLGGASATREFLDRWRGPGELRTRAWEERFGEQRYAELAGTAWDAGRKGTATGRPVAMLVQWLLGQKA